MGPQLELSPWIAFGPFEFNASSGDLRKYGNRIRLQGQPLQILGVLTARPGQVISRDELQRQLWDVTALGDFEQGLNAAVNKLRQALGDSADQPRYVETLAGRGYRFIAPIHRGSGKAVVEMGAPPLTRTETARPKRAARWAPWSMAVALAGAAMGSYWLGFQSKRPGESPRVVRLPVAPPAGFALEGAASRQALALSPDGGRLAFTAVDEGGAQSVFIRDFSFLEPRLIPETKGAHTLFWAPDGDSLFVTVKGQLRRAPLAGDAQVVLGEAPSFLISGASLGPGKVMLCTNHGSYIGSSSGGNPEPTRDSYSWPQLLPDGEHILYVDWDERARRYRARARRLAGGGSVRELLESDSRVLYTGSTVAPGRGYLLHMRGGNLLAQPFDPQSLRVTGEAMAVASKVYSFFPTGAAEFSASAKGAIAYQRYASRSQLVWVDRQGRRVEAIGPADINVKSGRLSPDGQRLAAAIYDVERGAQDLWVFETKTGAGRRLTSMPGMRDAAVWSPDSRRLAYMEGSGGRPPRIAIRGLGEKDAEVVTASGGFQLPTDWSSDGRFIVFSNTGMPRFANETQGDVWAVDLARDRKLVPLLNTLFHEANAAFSPDAKWLAFTSNESGQPELYVQAFEASGTPRVTGERLLVSRSGALAVRWRRDGSELFYLGFDGRVYAVPVALSRSPKFGPARPLFAISTEARAAIHSISGFDASGDGQRFVVPAVAPSLEGPSLVVIQNWEAGLPGSSGSAR
ncbi:MAG: PD40 domain-containing protein [Candidatus Solibacter usitatus]|nr:PD40 domain-containing protein [Candidatus Solibacter usitatus]